MTEEELDEFEKDMFGAEDDGLAAESNEESTLDAHEEEQPDLDNVKPENQESNYSNLWDGLSDVQRQEVTSLQSNLVKAQHAASSDRGRHKALQLKLKELEAEKAALEVKAAEPANESQYSEEEFAAMKDELPEVSAIVDEENRALKNQIAELSEKIETVSLTAGSSESDEDSPYVEVDPLEIANGQEAYVQEQQQIVLEAHPDFREICADPNYSTWLGRQADGIQALANSHKAEDANALFSMFKQARKPAANLDSELDSMTDIPSKGASKSSVIPEEDFDKWFEHYGEKLSK